MPFDGASITFQELPLELSLVAADEVPELLASAELLVPLPASEVAGVLLLQAVIIDAAIDAQRTPQRIFFESFILSSLVYFQNVFVYIMMFIL